MKKLLLVSALFIFACSSDVSNENNSSSLTEQKLIESITVISPSCENTYNLWMFYDNQNRIDSFQTQYYETSCDLTDDDDNYDIVNWQINYDENIISLSAENNTATFPINEDGHYNDINLNFTNGYLISTTADSPIYNPYNCGLLNVWNNNNLVEGKTYLGANCSEIQSTIYEYYEDINPIPFFRVSWHNEWSTAFMLSGIFGKQSQNLVSKITTSSGYNNFNYQFDDEGYPSIIYVERFNLDNDTPSSYVNYEIKYIE